MRIDEGFVGAIQEAEKLEVDKQDPLGKRAVEIGSVRGDINTCIHSIFQVSNGFHLAQILAISDKESRGRHYTKEWPEELRETLRLVLRDMLIRLHEVVDGDEDDVGRIQTVGILNAGLKLQMIRCWGKKKGGVILYRTSDIHEYPEVVEKIDKLWHLLKLMMLMRVVIEEVSEVVCRKKKKRKDVEDLLMGHMNG
ncbi:hypothetical protein EX30DRAFT_375308 [Ascodesmis nigricans]|uniref:Uncharacterized protein n=1 Tax=Ascodesmis nigricans TaxID=341454 RepID=A0A4S2MN77_9PEZI|nr:hypothetical protein EX30DRAFT_375308 [Ascodesmis nigricans]